MRRANQPETRHSRPGPGVSVNGVSTGAYYDKSWALVVGINDYGNHHPRLYNARNDAEAIAKILKETYSFDDVISLFDNRATKKRIMEWLHDQLPDRVGPDDRLVFFFAGHAVTRKGMSPSGYLIPYGTREGKYADFINMAELREACGVIPAKHILLILDCCFSGIAAMTTRSVSLPSRFRSDAYLDRMTKRKAYQVITAGNADELALDSGTESGHSAFTSALLRGLEGAADHDWDGLITANDLYRYLKPEVMRDTTQFGGKGQEPYYTDLPGSEQGDFLFKKPEPEPKVKPAALPKREKGGFSGKRVKLWAAAIGAITIFFAMTWFAWGREPEFGEWLEGVKAKIAAVQHAFMDPQKAVEPAATMAAAGPGATTEPGRTPTPTVTSTPSNTRTPTPSFTSTPTRWLRPMVFENDIFGQIGPYQEHWYEFTNQSDALIFVAFSPNVNLGGGEQMQFYVYHQDQIPHWPPPEPDKLSHLGRGSPVERDGDGGTGEFLWRGPVLKDTRYYVWFVNRSGSWINYCISFKDLFGESCLK